MKKTCDKCGRELKISPCKLGNGNAIVTKVTCEEHGVVEIVGVLYDEAKRYYKELEE